MISPGGVGHDINCGVRLMRTDLAQTDVAPRIRELVAQLFRDVPGGLGRGRKRLTASLRAWHDAPFTPVGKAWWRTGSRLRMDKR